MCGITGIYSKSPIQFPLLLRTELAPHVDVECERVSHVHRSRDPRPVGPVAVPDLHVALGWGQGEVDRVGGVHPKKIFGYYSVCNCEWRWATVPLLYPGRRNDIHVHLMVAGSYTRCTPC